MFGFFLCSFGQTGNVAVLKGGMTRDGAATATTAIRDVTGKTTRIDINAATLLPPYRDATEALLMHRGLC